MKSSDSGRVPIGKKVAYAAPAFALAIVGIPVYVYIPKFYTDVVGVNIAMLGYLLLAVRLFDAITDLTLPAGPFFSPCPCIFSFIHPQVLRSSRLSGSV